MSNWLRFAVLGIAVFAFGAWVLAPAADAQRRDHYAAIAYSPSKQKHGYAYDHPNQQKAERAALQNCGVDDCKVVLSFRNGCGALAVGRGGYAAGAAAADVRTARSSAVTRCGKSDGGCNVVISGCTR